MNKASKKKALKDKNRLTPVKITNSDFDEIKSVQDLSLIHISEPTRPY